MMKSTVSAGPNWRPLTKRAPRSMIEGLKPS